MHDSSRWRVHLIFVLSSSSVVKGCLSFTSCALRSDVAIRSLQASTLKACRTRRNMSENKDEQSCPVISVVEGGASFAMLMDVMFADGSKKPSLSKDTVDLCAELARKYDMASVFYACDKFLTRVPVKGASHLRIAVAVVRAIRNLRIHDCQRALPQRHDCGPFQTTDKVRQMLYDTRFQMTITII